MIESMPLGQMTQELTYLRAKYEQFIIDREQERIIKLLIENYTTELDADGRFRTIDKLDMGHLIALIKGETE